MFRYRILIKKTEIEEDSGFILKEIIIESEKNFDVRQGDARMRLMDEYFKWQINTALSLGDDPGDVKTRVYDFSVLKEEMVA